MYILSLFIERHGYLLLFALGFIEFLGIPSATVPALLVVGAVAAQGGIHPVGAVASLVAGALVAETFWYLVSRWQGPRIVRFACGFASSPAVCIFTTEERLRNRGPVYLVLAKFIPGAGSVPAMAAGFTKLAYRRFVAFDACALALWGGAYIFVGWLLEDKVEQAIEWLAARGSTVVSVLVVLFVLAVTWRFVKVRLHEPMHEGH